MRDGKDASSENWNAYPYAKSMRLSKQKHMWHASKRPETSYMIIGINTSLAQSSQHVTNSDSLTGVIADLCLCLTYFWQLNFRRPAVEIHQYSQGWLPSTMVCSGSSGRYIDVLSCKSAFRYLCLLFMNCCSFLWWERCVSSCHCYENQQSLIHFGNWLCLAFIPRFSLKRLSRRSLLVVLWTWWWVCCVLIYPLSGTGLFNILHPFSALLVWWNFVTCNCLWQEGFHHFNFTMFSCHSLAL